ncbi:MAG TPA: L-threonylcarbamoyladenylate synthase [Dissulfurispiraceae bacterium]|nr:L-threonylcarbamoyladenylate synthase [Dissulfurispiraceae bacterium]
MASSDTNALSATIEYLNTGRIIAYPTETFYGLGARHDDGDAIRRIYAIKHRPADKTLPVIIGSRTHLGLLTDMKDQRADILMERFWPGPLTLIVPALPGLTEGIVYEKKIAVRIPGPSFALALACAAGFPITSTSANVSGLPAAASAQMVIGYFGDAVDLVIDGGESPSSLPSTIVDLTAADPVIVREGIIPAATILALIR